MAATTELLRMSKDMYRPLCFVAILCACGAEKPASTIQPTFSEPLTSAEGVQQERAFRIFSQVCQPLMGDFSSDIERVGVSGSQYDGCFDYRCEEFGWSESVQITVVIKDEPMAIPPSYRSWGQSLHFHLGGPSNAGITTTKLPELCGFSRIDGVRTAAGSPLTWIPYRLAWDGGPDSGGDSYAPIADLAFIGATSR